MVVVLLLDAAKCEREARGNEGKGRESFVMLMVVVSTVDKND